MTSGDHAMTAVLVSNDRDSLSQGPYGERTASYLATLGTYADGGAAARMTGESMTTL